MLPLFSTGTTITKDKAIEGFVSDYHGGWTLPLRQFCITTALANMYGNAGQIGEFPNVREHHTLKLVSRTYSEMHHIVPSSQPHRYQFKPASMYAE